MCGGPVNTAEDKKRRQEYEDEEDHRTLTRAEEIRADTKRMAGVMRHHRKQKRAVSRMSRVVGRRA